MTKKQATINEIKRLMILHATNSPTKLVHLMAQKGRRLSTQTVHKHVKKIRADIQEYCRDLAKDTYLQTAEDEHAKLNELIDQTFQSIKDCKPGAQRAMMLNAFIALNQRRQYVMEDMVMDSSDGKWEKTYYPDTEEKLEKPQHAT